MDLTAPAMIVQDSSPADLFLGRCSGGWRPSPTFLMTFFIFTNFFNYLDRGIIPGAASEFDAFITNSKEIDDDAAPDTYLGLLQSSFVVGLSVSMPIFANYVHTQPPFRLVGLGLAVWCVSALLAGMAKGTNSYTVLVLARMLSGVGEGSFQVVAAPYIQDHAGKKVGLWLGLYYTAIPFGTCIGYGYGACFASEWPWAFWLEALLMAPAALMCFMLAPDVHLDEAERGNNRASKAARNPILRLDDDDAADGSPAAASNAAAVDRVDSMSSYMTYEEEGKGPTMLQEGRTCLSRPLFVWSSLGYAAYSGGIIGFSTFGPQFVMGLGFFDDEFTASMVFGGTMAAAGLVGTPIGGFLADWCLAARRRRAADAAPFLLASGGADLLSASTTTESLREPLTSIDNDDHRNVSAGGGADGNDGNDDEDDGLAGLNALALSCQMNFLGCIFVVLVCMPLSRGIFFIFFFVGGLMLFMSTSTMNISVLESVPPMHRSFAIGFATLLMHALGDVPSPIVIGAMKDALAPDCSPTDDDGTDDLHIPSECKDQRDGLRTVIALIAMWLLISPVCFGVGWAFASARVTSWWDHWPFARSPSQGVSLHGLRSRSKQQHQFSRDRLPSSNDQNW
jgi:MFS family permease